MSNRFLMPLAAFSLVAACGPKEPAPAPAVPGATAVADVVPAPSAPATPTPTPTPSPTPAEPEVATGPDGYLVWFQGGEKGHETHWLGRDAVGAYSALATRPQAALVAAGTLWLVEPRHVPYRETSCEVLEMEEDAQVKPAPGPRRHLEYLVARAVSGPRAGDMVELTKPRSAYFDDTPDSAGVYGMIGEHYGRSHELDGAADGLIFGTSCEGAYSCGAHGDYACDFFVHAFGDPERRFDLAAIQKSLTAETQAVFAAWEKEAEGEYSEPGLEAIAMLAGKGNPAIRHRFVMEVSYVASGGDWGSYTQSRDVVAPPTPIHGLSDVPPPVREFLAARGVEGAFGWSAVTDGAASALAAFKDTSTLPAPRPADETPVAEQADVAAKALAEGRRLTREGRTTEALAAFDAAIQASPALARAWSGRGFAKFGAGDLEGAEADFQHALKLEDAPKFQGVVFYNLGQIAEKKGDTKAAIAAYEKAVQLAPSKAASARLEALRP